jgi:hypothetical protein
VPRGSRRKGTGKEWRWDEGDSGSFFMTCGLGSLYGGMIRGSFSLVTWFVGCTHQDHELKLL